VQVILDRILAQERKLQFSIVEEGLPLSGKKAAKSPLGRRKASAWTPPRQDQAKKRFGKKGKWH